VQPQSDAEDLLDGSYALDPLTLKLSELKLSEHQFQAQSNPAQDDDDGGQYPDKLRALSIELLKTKLSKPMIPFGLPQNGDGHGDAHYPDEFHALSLELLETKLSKPTTLPDLPLNSNACNPDVSRVLASELSDPKLLSPMTLPGLPQNSNPCILEPRTPVSKLPGAETLPELALSNKTCASPPDSEGLLNSLPTTLPEPGACPERVSYGYNTLTASRIARLWPKGVMVLMFLFPLILVAVLSTSTALTTPTRHTRPEPRNPWWTLLQSERVAKLPGSKFRKNLNTRGQDKQ
jgi:hypothetical protein